MRLRRAVLWGTHGCGGTRRLGSPSILALRFRARAHCRCSLPTVKRRFCVPLELRFAGSVLLRLPPCEQPGAMGGEGGNVALSVLRQRECGGSHRCVGAAPLAAFGSSLACSFEPCLRACDPQGCKTPRRMHSHPPHTPRAAAATAAACRAGLQRAASRHYLDCQPALWQEKEITGQLASTLGPDVDKAFAAVSGRGAPPLVSRCLAWLPPATLHAATLQACWPASCYGGACDRWPIPALCIAFLSTRPQAWQDDHRLLVGTKSNHLLQWDTSAGMLRSIPLPPAPPRQHEVMETVWGACGIHSVAVNPAGDMVATGGTEPADCAVLRLPDFAPVQTLVVSALPAAGGRELAHAAVAAAAVLAQEGTHRGSLASTSLPLCTHPPACLPSSCLAPLCSPACRATWTGCLGWPGSATATWSPGLGTSR